MSTEENSVEQSVPNISTGLWKTFNGNMAYVDSIKDGFLAQGFIKEGNRSIPADWDMKGQRIFPNANEIIKTGVYCDNLCEKVPRKGPEVLEVGKTYVGSEGSARYEVVAVGRNISGFSVLAILTGGKTLQTRPILIKEVKSLQGEGWLTEAGVWITGEYIEPAKVYVALLKHKNGTIFKVSYDTEDVAVSCIKRNYKDSELIGSKIVEIRQGKFDFGKEELQNGN